jgi:hypothetical protein
MYCSVGPNYPPVEPIEPALSALSPSTPLRRGGRAQSEIRNPQSEIRNPKSEIRNPQSAIRNPQSKIGNPQSAFCPLSSVVFPRLARLARRLVSPHARIACSDHRPQVKSLRPITILIVNAMPLRRKFYKGAVDFCSSKE